MIRLSRSSQCVLVVSAIILFVSSLAQAQDPMAKWKPSVGDKFMYQRVQSGGYYTPGQPRDTGSRIDTIVMEVVQSDTMYDSAHSAIAVEGMPQRYFYFSQGFDTMSAHSFAIRSLRSDYYQYNLWFDFSGSADTEVTIGSQHLTAYRSVMQRPVLMAAYNTQTGIYSPQLRWFTYLDNATSGVAGPSDLTVDEFESETLIAASSLAVYQAAVAASDLSIRVTGTLMYVDIAKLESTHATLNLLDPLGRPVRSWQLAASDGPREITLNVAEVPSGVYFLQLQGNGCQEQVQKIVITH